MALTSYLYIEGENQGKIDGSCDQAGREDSIVVFGMEHEIEIPKDVHTGLPTGQRIHHPLTILKKRDNSSPKLMQACTSGEQMKKFEIKYFRINPQGNEEHYFTTQLHQAIIVRLKQETPATFLEANKAYSDMESVSFTYSKITHTYVPKGIEAEDDWKTPKA